ncbi:hypothetical protein HYE76_10400 [Pseudomonas tolaasii]|uniref:hypothetical protein n=1 Tax=Pseudomonas tolaasii TaxID=29442 RepID=UPI0015A1AC1E|nr:hypothetical protein [Pseudomonas tolaasii]NWC26876.1 hypothetical protein [Pseudomonas tolaasii]
MTTNQTIDGVMVSREILRNLLHCGDTDSTITPFVTAQLRALLDAPAPLVVPLTGPKEWLDSLKPAAQPRGEPVARVEIGADRDAVMTITDDNWLRSLKARGIHQIVPLYAEQPAPVAVDVLNTGFYTTESGGGKYAISIGFRSMADMQAADAQLRDLLKSR